MVQKIGWISLLFITASFQTGPSGYGIIKKSVVGGEGSWDYIMVDSGNRRIYASHSTQVEVLNADTHEKIGVIPNLQGVHGIEVVPETGRGVVTNGRSNTATIFDLKTLAKIQDVPTGKNPDALLYDRFSKKVFVFNHSGGSVTGFDITTGKVSGTLSVGGDGVEAGVSDEMGTIFVNLEDLHEIVAFDATAMTIKSRWKLSPGEEPTGLAMDRKNHRLFASCHNELLMVVDSDNGKIVAKVPIGKRVDGAVFDSASGIIATSNGEGTVTIIKEIAPDEFKVLETVKTEVGARTIALDSRTGHLFLPTAQFGDRPAATPENPEPRPKVLPGTFMILELGKK
jgi:DNA-binding beta-propeller fold protein YncE